MMRLMIRIVTLIFAGLVATAPAFAQADFRSCLSGLQAQAAAKGVSGDGLRRGRRAASSPT